MIARQITLFGNGGSEIPFQLDLGSLRNALELPATPAATPIPKPTAIQVSLHPTAGFFAWHYDENEYAMLAKILKDVLRGRWSPRREHLQCPTRATAGPTYDRPFDRALRAVAL
jgi:hypothetical protein